MDAAETMKQQAPGVCVGRSVRAPASRASRGARITSSQIQKPEGGNEAPWRAQKSEYTSDFITHFNSSIGKLIDDK